MRVITKADRDAAVSRLASSKKTVNLSEVQIAAIQKATGQDSGVRYSAVVLPN
jgi:hypothetical protein